MGKTRAGTGGRGASDGLCHEVATRLAAYKHDVRRAVPGVERVVLFGSRARGEGRADSDYDVAVFFRDLNDRGRVRRILSDVAYVLAEGPGALAGGRGFPGDFRGAVWFPVLIPGGEGRAGSAGMRVGGSWQRTLASKAERWS